MKNIHRQLLQHIQAGERIALATIVNASGSTPQKPGSSALFGEKGLILGTIGGGQLEGEVETLARHALVSGISGLFHFNLNTDPDSKGAICGGKCEVLLDASPEKHKSVLEEIEHDLSLGKEGYMCSRISSESGQDTNISRKWISGKDQPSDEERTWLLRESIKPFPRLIIAGAGHVGRALAHIASLLDFEITIVDDRREYACQKNIPDADHFIVEEIGPAMTKEKFDPNTYIVIVTRDHKNDAESLKPCIKSNAAYVGMIGSRHKVAIIKKRFLESGFATEEEWAKIHTPIGINIASVTVQEIAISIAAELVLERAKIKPNDA